MSGQFGQATQGAAVTSVQNSTLAIAIAFGFSIFVLVAALGHMSGGSAE